VIDRRPWHRSSVIYQHPLAYLIGLEGLTLLQAWGGDHDEAFVRARLAEVRRLLDEPILAGHAGVEVSRGDTLAGYRAWAATYDEPRNTIFDLDEPVVHDILDALPSGTALDAACGTGRFAHYLAVRGHQVVGVDSSPEMLARARERVPAAEFRLGDLHDLPLDDHEVDLVVCALALAHVPALGAAMAEFARVLRPGGYLVISDAHHELVFRGSVPKAIGPNGEPGLVATYRHSPGAFLRAALAAGLIVRRCEEPMMFPGNDAAEPAQAESDLGGWENWPWTLLPLIPAAANAAWTAPGVIIWLFQRGTRDATHPPD
jgi:SAM-dependent methyltransferase